ncbi:hypothetical protein PSP20601_05504 [Pandoraea sputorum]|nr:hypothetical protein PSP20601_05504 [Pandoraea sputorum]
MDDGPTFEANAKTAKVVKPRMSTLDNPAEFAQATAVFCPAPGEHRFDAALAKPLTMRLGIVATVCVDDFGLQKRLAAHAANGWDRVDERQQLGDVVAVRAGQHCADGDAICIDEDVMLGTWSRAIRGVRARFLPASTARAEDESTTAREKLSSPASRNLSSSSWCNLIHTPAFCQSRKRLQQVGPEPNPNLVDRSHQRIPVLNTNRMPFNAARFETGSRPGYFWRRGFGGGSKGSISAHSSSSMIGVPIPSVPVVQMAKVNRLPKRLTAPWALFETVS